VKHAAELQGSFVVIGLLQRVSRWRRCGFTLTAEHLLPCERRWVSGWPQPAGRLSAGLRRSSWLWDGWLPATHHITSHHIMQIETQRPRCRSSGINTSTEDTCFLSSPRVLERFQLTCQNKMAQLVEAMCYKPEGRGFDSRLSTWNFSLANPSVRTMTLGLT